MATNAPASSALDCRSRGAPQRPSREDHSGRRKLEPQQADEPKQEARREKPPARCDGVARVEEPIANDEDVRGDNLGQRAAAEIDELRRDRDRERGGEGRKRSVPAARPQKAAHGRRAGQKRKDDGDQRQVIGGSIAEDARCFHQPADRAGQQPRSHAELKFPGHDAVAEDETVCRLHRLKDLVVPIEARHKQHRHEPQADRQQRESEQRANDPPLLFRQRHEVDSRPRRRLRATARAMFCCDAQASLMRGVPGDVRRQGLQPRGSRL